VTQAQLAQRNVMPVRMRYCIYAGFGALWLTGCLWLILQEFFTTAGTFGIERHPWQGALLLLHGVLAIATSYLFGWVMARHAADAWRRGKRRISGGAFTAVLIVLSVTGFALFFVSEPATQWWSERSHELLGIGVTLLAVEHWRAVATRQSTESSSS